MSTSVNAAAENAAADVSSESADATTTDETAPVTGTVTPPASSRFATLADQFKKIWKLLTGAITKLPVVVTALVGIMIAVVFVRQASPRTIKLTTVTISNKLTGVGADALTYKLAQEIDAIKRAARPSPGQEKFVVGGDIPLPDVEVPFTGMTMEKLRTLVDEVLGRNSLRVNWEISETSAGSPSPWIVSAHMPGRSLHTASFDPLNPGLALAQIAKGLLRDVEPLILARALVNDGQCADGVRIAQEILSLEAIDNRAQAAALNFLGFAYECQAGREFANLSQAIRYYRAARALDQGSSLPHANMGRMYAIRAIGNQAKGGRRADIDSMRTAFVLAAKLDPSQPGVYEHWGLALSIIGEPDTALRMLNRAIQLEPRISNAYFLRAQVLHALGRFDESATNYSLGIARAPTNVIARKAYGHELILLGDWQAAVGAFYEALRLEPTDIDTKYYLGCVMKHVSPSQAHAILNEVKVALGNESPYSRYADLIIASDTVSCR